MHTKIYPLLLLALFAGCENAPSRVRSGPYVKPGLVMIPADQARFYGVGSLENRTAPQEAPPGYAATDVRSVQTDSAVTAIQFNRYADPGRPHELMHEAHVVYRRESLPQWRLQPASGEQQILVGPRLTDGRGEIKALASQELDQFLREQRGNLEKQQQALGQMSEGVRQLAEQQQQLAKELATLRAGASVSVPPAPRDLPHGSSENSAPAAPPGAEPAK